MNLVVAARHHDQHLRFEVDGRWGNGDALKLAYLVKAAIVRVRQDHVLIDLRRVLSPPGAEGPFLICDRLRRALPPSVRVGLLAASELIDAPLLPGDLPHCAEIALFSAEPEALNWLSGHERRQRA